MKQIEAALLEEVGAISSYGYIGHAQDFVKLSMDNSETIKKNLIKVEEIIVGDLFGNGSFNINLNENNILYSNCNVEEWRKFIHRLDLIKQSFYVSNLLCRSGSMWCYDDIIDTEKVEESFLEVRMTYDNKPLILRFDRSNELKCNSIILTFGDLVYDLETFDWLTSKSKIKEDLVNLFNNSIFFDYKDESKPKINEEDLKEMISMFFPDYRGFEVKRDNDYFGGFYKIGPLRDTEMGSGFQRIMRLYPALKRSKEYNLPLFVRDFDESLHPLLGRQLFRWFREDNDSQVFCRFQNVSNPYI